MQPTMLAERYQLGELIATGGMGTVHRAVDTHLGRPVAVKILKRVLADDATFLERFRREARAAAVISHPGVARVYDYGERSSEPFIVMELVDGDTLAERIARGGPLPWQQAFAIAEQVAAALSAAHTHGVVHRDVKPANILIDRAGRVKVTDFGIARAARATTLTRPGMVLGSANYVAPEQAQGNTVGPAADLYSLGCVLFESVTGSTPYQGRSAVAIATQHVSAPVPDPGDHVADLPEPAARLIMRSLGKQPGDRFPSAASMAAALRDVRLGRDPSAPSDDQNDQTVVLPALDLSDPLDAAAGLEAPGGAEAPEAVTTALPRAEPAAGRPVVGRGREAAAGSKDTPPMGWARVPGDVPPGGAGPRGAGPGGPPGRWTRGEHPGRRRGRRWATWLLGLALSLVALLALPLVISRHNGEASTPRPASPPPAGRGGDGATLATSQVRLPDLRGERLGDATAKLRALDLQVAVQRDGGGGRHAVVVAMSPLPDSAVDHGTTVELQVVGRPGKDKGGDASKEGD
jgi:hypothetical protein